MSRASSSAVGPNTVEIRGDPEPSDSRGLTREDRLRHLTRLARQTGRDVVERLGTAAPEPVRERAVGSGASFAASGSGTEDPRALAGAIPLVDRAFAFLDLCGFTQFIATHGEYAAIDALTTFRSLTREIATRRGVIVEKWLGDGAMLVGGEVGPTIASAAELIARYPGDPLLLRGGVAHGRVLIFDGDDYIGRPANLAARLCHAARPGELLAVGYAAESLPSWIRVRGTRDLTLRGLGRLRRVQRLELAADLELPPLTRAPSSDRAQHGFSRT